MRTTENVRCWNSPTVWEAEASTVNTNQDKNKYRLGVRKPICIEKNGSHIDTASCATC